MKKIISTLALATLAYIGIWLSVCRCYIHDKL